jgi:hypothetical protein
VRKIHVTPAILKTTEYSVAKYCIQGLKVCTVTASIAIFLLRTKHCGRSSNTFIPTLPATAVPPSLQNLAERRGSDYKTKNERISQSRGKSTPR